MKRRDFVKAFAASAASITLARANGSEKVIETFQISDIRNEHISTNSSDIDFVNFDDPMSKRVHLVLSKDLSRFRSFAHTQVVAKNISFMDFIYISRVEQLYGYKRGSQVIGLEDYWLNREYDKIAHIVYIREYQVFNPYRYFNNIALKTKEHR